MKALRPIIRELALFFHRRALKEIHPLHEDVPLIVLTIHRLELERKS